MNNRMRRHLVYDAAMSFIILTSLISSVITISCRVFLPITYINPWTEVATLMASVFIGAAFAKSYFLKFDIWMHKNLFKSRV